MIQRTVTVAPEDGLHARPASKFVETATEFDADITVTPVGEDVDPADARSMLAVTALGVAHGDAVELCAEGEDASAAVDALETILSTSEHGDSDADEG